jgi:hypothetical protein
MHLVNVTPVRVVVNDQASVNEAIEVDDVLAE